MYIEDTTEVEDTIELEQMQARKERVLQFIKSEGYIPLKRHEIATVLSVPTQDKAILDEIINQFIQEGKAVETKKGKIMSAKAMNMIAGTFISNAKGFGFVSSEELENDVFIPPDNTGGALHRDKVLCKISHVQEAGKRSEGEIIKILERGRREIVGTFEDAKGFGFVVPDDKKMAQDIFVAKEDSKGAVSGHKVVVQITKFPEGRRSPEGKIVEILGHINDPGVDILSIIREFELPVEFSEEVYTQVEHLESTIAQKELEAREDFTKVLTVTIDGEDAKDLDDAVSLSMLSNGNFSLGVHIADVTHYVRQQTPLDKQAYERGTSVYLVDRVIPMLPHKLSNGICSLNPKENRLALSCIMEIDAKGNVVAHRIVKSVICSDERMTYTVVNRIIEEKEEDSISQYSHVSPMLLKMEELRVILSRKRRRRGAVNFDFAEAKIILDENGVPTEIKPYERNSATNLIEEFMLVCNETVAEDYFWQEIPFVYRNHETPDGEKLQKLEQFLRGFGYRLKGIGDIHPKAMQQILDQASGKPEEHIISRVVLRSMKQARYMAENEGHFGLAAKYYCHFTSPIRRYPDLQIHRIIKENMDGRMTEKRRKGLEKKLPEVAKRCSMRERIAEDAERETDKVKMVEYMSRHIGDIFSGVISSVTSWGIYVELPNTIEGMVAVSHMDDDYYVYDNQNMQLCGKKRGKVYGIGQTVLVQVIKADKQMRTIDFIFTEEAQSE